MVAQMATTMVLGTAAKLAQKRVLWLVDWKTGKKVAMKVE